MKEGGPLTRQSALGRSGDVSHGRLNEDMAVKIDGGEEKMLCNVSVGSDAFVLFPSNCLGFRIDVEDLCGGGGDG